jgi:catechol 2,3-dioxygenase-like lactoylglutathione lyase family enzyme
MITGVHALVYADDPEAARAFFRDVLEWPYVDAHDGWLIFGTGPSELGVHPTSGGQAGEGQAGEGQAGESPAWHVEQHHEVTLMCDDIKATVAALEARGARFTGEIKDQGFGLTTMLKVPGAGDVMLYQPRHAVAYRD